MDVISALKSIEKKTVVRALSFAAYFMAAFLIFLLLLFPYDRVRSRLESEVRTRTPLELTVGRISPRFFNRFVLHDVVLADQTGKTLFTSASVKTKVSLLGFLGGMLSVDLDAPAYGGRLSVKARQAKALQTLMVDLDGMDLASYPPLRDMGLRMTGKIGGNLEMNGDAGRGKFWVKDLSARELTVKGFPVPDLDFQKGWLEADLKGDRLTIRKLELEGKDLTIRASGDLVLHAKGTLNLLVKLKPSERLSREQAGIVGLLKNRDAEGFYQLTLGGTLDAPLPRL